MDDVRLYPLRFDPIFRPMIWGGRRLAEFLPGAPESEQPIGEAWVLSDQGDSASVVTEGPLRGRTLRELMGRAGARLLGRSIPRNGRFPLLLKFLDARANLSVQVHPNDDLAAQVASDAQGKTEAWVILHADRGSRLYAGLRPGVDEACLRRSLAAGGAVADCLHSFTPRPGDCVFLRAGTVHALGAGVMLFELQQTSDITYRLYDWDRVDARTGRPRELHVEESLTCTDFAAGPCDPLRPEFEATAPVRRERLVSCEYFRLWRHQGERPFAAGAGGECRVVVGLEGWTDLEHDGIVYPVEPGSVLLLPAEVGACQCRPRGAVTVLECGLGASVNRPEA
jgi:mannose-6-phosphate isomerase